jgi:RNA polymerase sigma-70 factor, ECF subfamily
MFLGCATTTCDPPWAEQSSWLVDPKRDPDGQDEAPTLLGDLLYADRSATTTPEDDWVRLVRAMAGGDQQALRALYQRSHRLVFTLAMRIAGSRESAEEITLDVFHDLWRRASEYDPQGGSVVGWIMNQARSRAIDRHRFDHRKKRLAAHADAGEPAADASGPGDDVDIRERRSLLEEALTALTSDERQAIETAFFAELSYAETAIRLDQPLGTVKTRVRSALAKLRKALDHEGGER